MKITSDQLTPAEETLLAEAFFSKQPCVAFRGRRYAVVEMNIGCSVDDEVITTFKLRSLPVPRSYELTLPADGE